MIGESEVTIAGFKFEKIDGKRIIQSVYLLDALNGDCIEVSISDDIDLDKEKLAKELLSYFRKDAVVSIDIQNDLSRPNSNYVNVSFVGVKNVNNKEGYSTN